MFDRFHPRYLVPNAITGANLLMAMVAIVQASRGMYESAAWLIVWCVLLDRMDGVSARLVNACSDFGIQFDTLADLLAFCAAPGLLVYFLLTGDPRYAPIFASHAARAALLASVGAYVLLGAMRLARFNVHTRSIGPDWSCGLPVTIAAAVVSTFMLATWDLGLPGLAPASPLVLVVCAIFMISRLWLPKSLARGSQRLRGVQAVGAVTIYGLGTLRMLPALLLAVALAYPALGFLYGRLLPPHKLEREL